MYKIILVVFSVSISLFMSGCGSSDSKDVTICANTLMNETNCYLEYVKLDAEAKACCDTWIAENKE